MGKLIIIAISVAALVVPAAAMGAAPDDSSSRKAFVAPRYAARAVQSQVDRSQGNFDVACAAFSKYLIQCSGEWQSKLMQHPNGGYDPPLGLYHSYTMVVRKLDRHTLVFDTSTNGGTPGRQIVRVLWNA